MNKKAIVILAEGFEEIEAVSTIDILKRASIEVVVASLLEKPTKGSRGLVVVADEKLEDVEADFDALILPGGMPGAKNLSLSEKVNSLIQVMHKEGKIIAAICASPAIVLAPTGILKGKTATCYTGMQDNFDDDVKYSEKNVVIDKNIITSRGVGTALEFSLAIVESLLGKETRDEIAKKALIKY